MDFVHQELLIGGIFLGGPCDQSIGKTQHYAPYSSKLIGTAAEAGWAEVDAAIAAAEDAFHTFRFSSLESRSSLLTRIAETVTERRTELANLLCQEVGKPIIQAESEVDRLALTFHIAARAALKSLTRSIDITDDPRSPGVTATATRVPIGPILAIVPYNWPLNLAAHKIAPAIATGNTVVVKAPSIGTLSTLALCRIVHECGCPDGVVNAINTVPALAQKAVLDPRIKMLSFTGSPQVGWMLKGLVPQKRVTLELGGDATAILTPTTNLAHAAKSLATAAFAYAGQICISLQHILCHSSIYDRFKAQFLAEVERIPYGNPADRATICGPLISDEAADHIMTIIAEAELAGASILAGGNRLARVIQPTVLENVSRSVTLGCQEAFGPVVTLQPYDNLAEAIDWVNVSQYGIHASIYTQDQDEHQRAFAELETGGLIVNDAPTLRFDAMPYGGVKQSGFGREGIENTMLEMTEDKTIAIRRLVD